MPDVSGDGRGCFNQRRKSACLNFVQSIFTHPIDHIVLFEIGELVVAVVSRERASILGDRGYRNQFYPGLGYQQHIVDLKDPWNAR